jgi:hypothetical protein
MISAVIYQQIERARDREVFNFLLLTSNQYPMPHPLVAAVRPQPPLCPKLDPNLCLHILPLLGTP